MVSVARLLKMILYPLAALCLAACGSVGDHGGAGDSSGVGTIGGGDNSSEMYKPVALLWEDQNKNGVLWSAYVYQIIGTDLAPDLLPGSDDIQNFCPNYGKLNNSQKVNFWAYLVSAIAKYASGFNPVASAIDLSRGIDAITGKQTFSEGLLQLSYQDVQKYDFCAFSWTADQTLSPGDIARTILDPLKNLDCGMKILATEIAASKKIASNSTYWTILKKGVLGNQVAAIENLTSALPFCASK